MFYHDLGPSNQSGPQVFCPPAPLSPALTAIQVLLYFFVLATNYVTLKHKHPINVARGELLLLRCINSILGDINHFLIPFICVISDSFYSYLACVSDASRPRHDQQYEFSSQSVYINTHASLLDTF